MRTPDGEEIVNPGDYEMSDGSRLRVYLTEDDDEQVRMWACTHCQEVDGVVNALLVGVIDGNMDLAQNSDGEFSLKMTQAGLDQVRNLIERLAKDDEEEQE